MRGGLSYYRTVKTLLLDRHRDSLKWGLRRSYLGCETGRGASDAVVGVTWSLLFELHARELTSVINRLQFGGGTSPELHYTACQAGRYSDWKPVLKPSRNFDLVRGLTLSRAVISAGGAYAPTYTHRQPKC